MGIEDRIENETPELDIENVLEGRGLEEISKVGWEKYRTALNEVSYADMINRQIEQIDQIKANQDPKVTPMPEWALHNKNAEAKIRANELSKWFQKEYEKEAGHNFFAFQQGDKKLVIRGNDIGINKKGELKDNHLNRIYLTVPTQYAPEAFKALFDTFTDEGVIKNVDLVLNLENYQADSLDKSFENNTIVIYGFGKDPEMMTKICRSIERAKTQYDPKLWKLNDTDLVKAKESILKDLMIPLDQTSAFVEADNMKSHHQGPSTKMLLELTGEAFRKDVTPEKLVQSLEKWTPEKPGSFESEKTRKRYMPGLILE